MTTTTKPAAMANAKTNAALDELYDGLVRVTRTAIDQLERKLNAPPPPVTVPFSDDPDVCAARRWLSDHYALWLFCDNAACLRACRCRGRHVACYRFTMDRVPDDAIAGMRLCLDAHVAGEDPLKLRGEQRRAIDALIAWRRRFGLTPLPWSVAPAKPRPHQARAAHGTDS
ncbi:hypothetical protein DW352_05900 [Pseudolabrys taiwanensis]|uniref:Uncharacterized protein n=1 Tax=Pseudolabrys taiwanensis TaxID=331696 RepID=A0A345ZT41_9HYPH|nr:hypothetical protein [Pseudolabrys taiwanensis]AXK80088.1 hypothetical protein DW352_05900 [Pseudolabrys taiwanensis]